jgi:hypothetical protein
MASWTEVSEFAVRDPDVNEEVSVVVLEPSINVQSADEGAFMRR